uniref:Uncharacterized protein n=1 Tax=Arundo donax TaxID=35708 RepID=A0A0A9CF72_ARUDO
MFAQGMLKLLVILVALLLWQYHTYL